MPEIVAVYQKYHERGLEVIGVSLNEDPKRTEYHHQFLAQFTQEKGMMWPQGCDGKGWKSELVTRYAVDDIPQLFLVNKRDVVTAGNDAYGHLDETVAKLLAG